MTDKTEAWTGMIHVNEDEMRAAGDGVFAKRAADRTVGPTQQRAMDAARENKAMKAAPSNKAEGSSLSAMTKAELLDVAKAEGVAVESDDNKADLVAKIEKARKA